MTTYYFGNMEFGDFVKGDDYYPIILIHDIIETREFATEEEADDYMVENKYSGYCDANTKNAEIYFRKR
jgi:hypothetical protein